MWGRGVGITAASLKGLIRCSESERHLPSNSALLGHRELCAKHTYCIYQMEEEEHVREGTEQLNRVLEGIEPNKELEDKI